MQTNASGNPPAPLPGAVNLRWLSVIHYNVPDDASSYNSDWIQWLGGENVNVWQCFSALYGSHSLMKSKFVSSSRNRVYFQYIPS